MKKFKIHFEYTPNRRIFRMVDWLYAEGPDDARQRFLLTRLRPERYVVTSVEELDN